MIQDKTLKGFQVKSLFEYFNGLISKPGERPAFSAFIWNNYNLLQAPYYDLLNRIQQRDPVVVQYEQDVNALYLQFADRNEQGEIKFDENKQPVITERQIEFQEALTKLTASIEGLADKVSADHQREGAAMNGDFTVKVDCITLSEFINSCPPYVVGLTHL